MEESPSTRDRILAAAREEFARHGLAGARVDRVAGAAGVNKQRIYAWVGDKERLFDTVVESAVVGILDGVPFDAHDLPGYAVALAAHYRADPQLVALLLWHSLERPGVLWQLPHSTASMGAKAGAVAQAQADGLVRRDLAPEVVVELVLGLVVALVLRPHPDEEAARLDGGLASAVERLAAPAV